MKGKFTIVLIFQKNIKHNLFCSSFVDKGNEQVINLPAEKFKFIQPGMRYFCYLNSKTFEIIDIKIYIDDLFVVTDIENNVIKVLNHSEEVPEFTFDPTVNGNHTKYVHNLTMKFIKKEFQLTNRKDIDSFLEVYEKSCKLAYENHKKKLMNKGLTASQRKRAAKIKFDNHLIHTIL